MLINHDKLSEHRHTLRKVRRLSDKLARYITPNAKLEPDEAHAICNAVRNGVLSPNSSTTVTDVLTRHRRRHES